MHIWIAIPELLLIQALQKWLNLHFGPEQSYTNKLHRKRQLRFIMQHTVTLFTVTSVIYFLMYPLFVASTPLERNGESTAVHM